jgi:hypothetical protein
MSCKECGKVFGYGPGGDHSIVRFEIENVRHFEDGLHASKTTITSADSGEFCSTTCLVTYLNKHHGPDGDFYVSPYRDRERAARFNPQDDTASESSD